MTRDKKDETKNDGNGVSSKDQPADKGLRLLIIDDDVNLRELFSEVVRKWDYRVTVARSGDEGLERLKHGRFDVVITDLMMPGMNGLTFLKKVKERDPDVPVIIITGYPAIDTAVKAIEAGAFDYIAKPFMLDEFRLLIENAHQRRALAGKNRSFEAELRRTGKGPATLKGAALTHEPAKTRLDNKKTDHK